jgi:predicted PurR-regulated permease PerM
MAESRRSDAVLAVFTAAGLALCYVLRGPLVLIYVSIIFAVIFAPIVEKIHCIRIRRWSPSRGLSLLLLIGAVLIALGAFFALAVPPIVNDAQGLSHDLPSRLNQLSDRIRQLPFGQKIAAHINIGSVEKYLGTLMSSLFTFFSGLAGGITAFVTLIILSAYFILDGRRAFAWMLSLVPSDRRERLGDTLTRAGQRIQKWLGGQLMLMLILGCASAVTFWLLHVRYFYALAVFAGVSNFVPILGPIATVVIASLVAALDSWTKVLGVLIFYLVYQQVENSYLTPKIMKSTVDLPAVTVVAALLIGGELAGLLGAIVAVPTAALIATVVNEYLVQPDKKQENKEREGITLRKAS